MVRMRQGVPLFAPELASQLQVTRRLLLPIIPQLHPRSFSSPNVLHGSTAHS